MAMSVLGNSLSEARHFEDALSVQQADLSMMRRIGAPVQHALTVQGNIVNSYDRLGRLEEALSMRRNVYSEVLKLLGEEHRDSLREANNLASLLKRLKHFGEAKSLLRKNMPVARRVLGDTDTLTLMMKKMYAEALCSDDDGATLDDVREAVATLEDIDRTARRVLGGAHPLTTDIERVRHNARALLHFSEKIREKMSGTA